MKPFRVSVPLLVAVSDFAVPYNDKNDPRSSEPPYLRCVWLVDHSIVATNGHIMVCAPLHGDGPSDKEAFGVAPAHIRAMAGVAGALGEHSVEIGRDQAGVLFSMEVGEKRNQKIGLHVPAVDISARPNYRAVLAQQPSKGGRPHLAFNPEYLRRIAAVNQAQNCGWVKISAWGPSSDPILYENPAGTQFCLMAVSGDDDA